MTTLTALFYVFSAVLLFAGFRVITARTPVNAALYLVLAFFSAACVWMLLGAEFLAISLVLVYVGAVMVLFLFVVMMLDIRVDELRRGFWKHFPLAAAVGVVIALEMAAVLLGGFRLSDAPVLDAAAAKLGNTKMLGIEIYTRYLYPLQIAAVLLLVAIIAAIALTLRHRKDTKAIDASIAVRAKKANRVRLVKVQPVLRAAAAAEQAEAVAGTAFVQTAAASPAPRRRSQGMIPGPVTLGHFLSVGAILFALSVIGIFLNRKNLIVLLMAIELMLLAVNLNFVAFSHYLGDMAGQVFVFFILTVAAAESAIGLAILVVLFRNRSTISVEDLDDLKG